MHTQPTYTPITIQTYTWDTAKFLRERELYREREGGWWEKEMERMQEVMRENEQSNKGRYQRSEFKGQRGFGYESRPSMATSDLIPESPGGGAVELLSSSLWPTLPDLLCLPSAQVHYVHLFHRYNSPHINHSLSPFPFILLLSFPSIHGPNRAIDSSAGHCRIVWECEDEKERETESIARPLGRRSKASGPRSAWRGKDGKWEGPTLDQLSTIYWIAGHLGLAG